MIVRIVLALVVGLGLTAAGYQGALGLEADVRSEFQAQQAEHALQIAATRARDMEQVLRQNAMFFTAQQVSLVNFKPRLEAAQDNFPVFRVVSWFPVVPSTTANDFVAQVRRSVPEFTFREVDQTSGDIVPAGQAAAYVPFLIVAPKHGNDMLLGVDLGNQPNLAEAMQRSYSIDGVAAATPSVMPPDEGESILLLHYLPKPEGFVGGLVRVDDLLDFLLEGAAPGLVGRLSDESQTPRELAVQEGFQPDGAVVGAVTLGGRRLGLHVAATDAYRPMGMQLARAVLFGGAGVTLVLLALSLLGGGTASNESR